MTVKFIHGGKTMNKKRISIKNIVLGIIAIAITITICIGIARADVARVSLEKGRDLGLRTAVCTTDLRAGLGARLTLDGLHEVATLGRLGSKAWTLNSLDSLDGRLLG
jgi:hypothetical protein